VEQDDPVAEGAALGELQLDRGVRRREQGLAPPDADRVDVDPVRTPGAPALADWSTPEHGRQDQAESRKRR
jgi:hypothetical protein